MRVRRVRVPTGDAGTRATVHLMRRMARDAAFSPLVRSQALKIARDYGGRDADVQASAIRVWLERVIEFRRDPVGGELLYTPDRLLTILRGGDPVLYVDCDDVAVLAAALGRSIGLRARFVVVGFLSPRAPFRHIWAELAGPRPTDEWHDMDVTRSEQALPSAISRKWVTDV